MKKTFSFIFKLLSASIFLVPSYAGDSAAFEDLGFSQDGRTYVFAQYGKTDKKFQAWAEIYTVDVEKNEFVKNEVYKLEPSKKTSEISGKRAISMIAAQKIAKFFNEDFSYWVKKQSEYSIYKEKNSIPI